MDHHSPAGLLARARSFPRWSMSTEEGGTLTREYVAQALKPLEESGMAHGAFPGVKFTALGKPSIFATRHSTCKLLSS